MVEAGAELAEVIAAEVETILATLMAVTGDRAAMNPARPGNRA